MICFVKIILLLNELYFYSPIDVYVLIFLVLNLFFYKSYLIEGKFF
jgi:hypothetical protein